MSYCFFAAVRQSLCSVTVIMITINLKWCLKRRSRCSKKRLRIFFFFAGQKCPFFFPDNVISHLVTHEQSSYGSTITIWSVSCLLDFMRFLLLFEKPYETLTSCVMTKTCSASCESAKLQMALTIQIVKDCCVFDKGHVAEVLCYTPETKT